MYNKVWLNLKKKVCKISIKVLSDLVTMWP